MKNRQSTTATVVAMRATRSRERMPAPKVFKDRKREYNRAAAKAEARRYAD